MFDYLIKPGTIAPGSNIAIENDEENLIIYNPYDNKISINQQKINLPVYKNSILLFELIFINFIFYFILIYYILFFKKILVP